MIDIKSVQKSSMVSNLDRGYSTFAPRTPDVSPHEYHLLSAFMAHKAFVCWYCHLLESFLSLSRIAPDSSKTIHNGKIVFQIVSFLVLFDLEKIWEKCKIQTKLKLKLELKQSLLKQSVLAITQHLT